MSTGRSLHLPLIAALLSGLSGYDDARRTDEPVDDPAADPDRGADRVPRPAHLTMDAKPGTGLPPQLVETWTHGKMSNLIRWGIPGDFERCITAIQGEVTKDGKPPLSDHVIKGLCATLHRIATGASPGHAAGEHHG